MGEFQRAVRQLQADELACPACGARNKPAPAKPTLECEQNGSVTCSTCSANFIPKEIR